MWNCFSTLLPNNCAVNFGSQHSWHNPVCFPLEQENSSTATYCLPTTPLTSSSVVTCRFFRDVLSFSFSLRHACSCSGKSGLQLYLPLFPANYLSVYRHSDQLWNYFADFENFSIIILILIEPQASSIKYLPKDCACRKNTCHSIVDRIRWWCCWWRWRSNSRPPLARRRWRVWRLNLPTGNM